MLVPAAASEYVGAMRGDPSATTSLDPSGEIKILNLERPGKMIKGNTEEVLRTIIAMNVLELIPQVCNFRKPHHQPPYSETKPSFCLDGISVWMAS